MKRFSKFILILLIIGSIEESFSAVKNETTVSAIKLIEILSSDSIEGRAIGTLGFEKAAKTVEDYLKAANIYPFFGNSYRDSLVVNGTHTFNLIGILNPQNTSNQYILLGAHLDHLGKNLYKTDTVYNGANDNATGVAAVLHIAKSLSEKNLSKKVLVAIFTGEETNLSGSKHLAKRLKQEGVNLSYMINFEMLGQPLTTNPKSVYITGFYKSDFAYIVNENYKKDFIVYQELDDLYELFEASDNYPFYSVFNVPSHTISTYDSDNYEYLHHVKDEFSALDTEYTQYIINECADLIIWLLENNIELTLTNEE